MDAIDATAKQLQVPGFDHAYIDLIDSLRLPASVGDIDPNLEIYPIQGILTINPRRNTLFFYLICHYYGGL